jgi:hypothetical protein
VYNSINNAKALWKALDWKYKALLDLKSWYEKVHN